MLEYAVNNMAIAVYSKANKSIKITQPSKKYALGIHGLIKKSPPLDLNSSYLYLLQSFYFSNTCAVAILNEKVIGFVSGFINPKKQNSLFVWQVVIDEKFRGLGLGVELIEFILKKNRSLDHIETTVTKENHASRKMFRKIYEKYESNISEQVLFEKTKDFMGQHESEFLIKIGPIII
jgi:L-2,4-diaminobutyric acid acetyltransferase